MSFAGERQVPQGGAARPLSILGALYVSQGISHGFFGRALPTVLRQQGASLEHVGYASLVFLPWSVNFLWAPLVDRCHWCRVGRRRSWIIPLLVATAAVFIGIGFGAGQTDIPITWLIAAAIVASFLAATCDIATDGYAIDQLPPARRGLGNALQIGGYWIGMMIGGGVILVVTARWGITAGAAAIAGLFLAIAVAVAMTPETSSLSDKSSRPPSQLNFFRRMDAWVMIGIVVAVRFGDSLSKGMLQPFLVDIGLTGSEIGVLFGTVGVGASVAGSVFGGLSIRPLGRRRALLVFGILQAISLVGYWFVAQTGNQVPFLLPVVLGLEFFWTSCSFVALYTVMMDCCDPQQAGTDFTILACSGNLVVTVAGALSGHVAGRYGYPAHFAVGAVVALAGMAIAAFLTRRHMPASPNNLVREAS